MTPGSTAMGNTQAVRYRIRIPEAATGGKGLRVNAWHYSKQISTKNLPAEVEKGIMIFGPLDLWLIW